MNRILGACPSLAGRLSSSLRVAKDSPVPFFPGGTRSKVGRHRVSPQIRRVGATSKFEFTAEVGLEVLSRDGTNLSGVSRW